MLQMQASVTTKGAFLVTVSKYLATQVKEVVCCGSKWNLVHHDLVVGDFKDHSSPD